MRKSRLRRDKVRKRDIDCVLGRHCVYPRCTCPPRPGTAAPEIEGATHDDAPPDAPIRPAIKRKRRPKGWSPLSDWVVVRTKSRQENLVAMNCREQDIETWCPRIMTPLSGKPAALFPGYMFARPDGKYRKLSNTRGVLGLIMRGDGPEFVPKAAMKALRANADKDGIVTLPRQRKPEKGERVEIKIGAWKGFEGLYDGLDPEGRNRVLLNMFGKEVVLTFKRATSIEVTE